MSLKSTILLLKVYCQFLAETKLVPPHHKYTSNHAALDPMPCESEYLATFHVLYCIV